MIVPPIFLTETLQYAGFRFIIKKIEIGLFFSCKPHYKKCMKFVCLLKLPLCRIIMFNLNIFA